jgi:L-seryl-tRNA(Ser) seleniumtransferase
VNKEEILGMLVALELFMKRDHAAEWKEWERRTRIISDAVRDVPSVQTEIWVPEIANHVPHLKIRWDKSRVAIDPREVLKRLRAGKPSIEANPSTNDQELVIGVWMLQPGEPEVVARRIREVLKAG